MAKPINPTPVLSGKDAMDFLKDFNSVKYNPKKEKFLKECDDIFKKVSKSSR